MSNKKGYIGGIKPFRFVTHAILPLVYDDSLSYYEVLSKVVNKLNELIVADNNLAEATQQIVTNWLQESEEAKQAIENAIDEYVETYSQTPAFIENLKTAITEIPNFENLVTTAVEAWLISAEGVSILDGAVDEYLNNYVKTDEFKENVKDAVDALAKITRGDVLYIYQKTLFNAISNMSAITGAVLDDNFQGQTVAQVLAKAVSATEGEIDFSVKNGGSGVSFTLNKKGLHVPNATEKDNPVTLEQLNQATQAEGGGVYMIKAVDAVAAEAGAAFPFEIVLDKNADEITNAIVNNKLPVLVVDGIYTDSDDKQVFIFDKMSIANGSYTLVFTNKYATCYGKPVDIVVTSNTNRGVFRLGIFKCTFGWVGNNFVCDKTNTEIINAYKNDIKIDAVLDDVTFKTPVYVSGYRKSGDYEDVTFCEIPELGETGGISIQTIISVNNIANTPTFKQNTVATNYTIEVKSAGNEYYIDEDFDDIISAIGHGVNVAFTFDDGGVHYICHTQRYTDEYVEAVATDDIEGSAGVSVHVTENSVTVSIL